MEQRIERLLGDIAAGRISPDEGLAVLRDLPGEDLGFARLDHHRILRQGMPEVVYGEGKTPAQIADIVDRLKSRQHPVLVTRLDADVVSACGTALESGDYDELSRTWIWRPEGADAPDDEGLVLIVSAGTSDLPVAEEAARTAELFGNRTERLVDVGVAGIHRLLAHMDKLRSARVLIVVAGMEGALPSVVAGLVACPVIAVPTSVGYGASFEGLAALLSMLNSCASGVTVVNIDNGFGAACAATRIIHALSSTTASTSDPV